MCFKSVPNCVQDGDPDYSSCQQGFTTCAANTLTARKVWSCKRDEGRPLGAGDQEQAPNHCELLPSKAVVVSVAEKAGPDPVR
jgi:hypothetical protein